MERSGSPSDVSGSYRCRPATPEDEPFLRRLFASTREDLASLGLPQLIEMQYRAQRIQYESAYPNAQRFVVLVDGQVAGSYVTDFSGSEHRFVDIALLPEFRGSGIGSSLLRAACAQAAAEAKSLVLHVAADNRARGLYRRLGFVEEPTDQMYVRMTWGPPS